MVFSKLATYVCCANSAVKEEVTEPNKTKQARATCTKQINYAARKQIEYKITGNAAVSMHHPTTSVDNVSLVADSIMESQPAAVNKCEAEAAQPAVLLPTSETEEVQQDEFEKADNTMELLLQAPEGMTPSAEPSEDVSMPVDASDGSTEIAAPVMQTKDEMVDMAIEADAPVQQEPSGAAMVLEEVQPMAAAQEGDIASHMIDISSETAADEAHASAQADDMVLGLMAAMGGEGTTVEPAAMAMVTQDNMEGCMNTQPAEVSAPIIPMMQLTRGPSDNAKPAKLALQLGGTLTTPRVSVNITPATPTIRRPSTAGPQGSSGAPSKDGVSPRATSNQVTLTRLRSMPTAPQRGVSAQGSTTASRIPRSARMGGPTEQTMVGGLSPVRVPTGSKLMTPRRTRDGTMSARY